MDALSFLIMANTFFSGNVWDKLWLLSGQFSLTIKDSERVWAYADNDVTGLSWDGTDTLFSGTLTDKLFRLSGKFTSTIKDSEDMTSVDNNPRDVSSGDTNAPWVGLEAAKLYLQSGKFTSTIKDSETVGGIDGNPSGVSWDSTNTPWCGGAADKLYLQSGQFTSTIKDSESITTHDYDPEGITYDGTNTPWIGGWTDKLYLQSGQFTSTLKDSQSVTSLDSAPSGTCIEPYESRVAVALTRIVIDTLTITDVITPTIDRVPLPSIIDNLIISDGVLGYIDYIPVIDILTITDTIIVFLNVINVIDYLAITDNAYRPTTYSENVIDNLSISDLFISTRNVYEVSQILTLQQYVDLNDEIERTIGNSLSIGDNVTIDTTGFVFKIIDNLIITDSIIEKVPRTFNIEDTLTFTDTPDGIFQYNITIEDEFDILYIDTENLIIYRIMDTVERYYTAKRIPWNFLTIQQNVQVVNEKTGAISDTASNTLTISDEATVARSLGNSFTISDSITVTQGQLIKVTLSITDTVDLIREVNKQPSDTLVLELTVEYTHTESHTHHEYSPFVGVTTDPNAPTPPSLTEPTITTHTNVQLSYPIVSPTLTLTLRGPELGNQDQLGYTRVNRETRGGTLVIFADPDWPKREQLNLQFVGLSESESQDVLNFLRDTLGKQIKLRDWEGNEWTVITLTPDNTVVRNGYCKNAVNLDFESAL